VPRGGALVTHDIAIGLRTPPISAENLKIEFGNVAPSTVDPNKTIEVDSIGGRASQKVPLTLITDVINNRIKEILDACYKDILSEFTRLDSLTAGVILTGGTSLITNIHTLVEDKNGFNLPCRIAYPDMKRISGAVSRIDSPNYTCVIGLLYYVVKHEQIKGSKMKSKNKKNNNIDVTNYFKKAIKWITDL
jgi:cell division protein FtsA